MSVRQSGSAFSLRFVHDGSLFASCHQPDEFLTTLNILQRGSAFNGRSDNNWRLSLLEMKIAVGDFTVADGGVLLRGAAALAQIVSDRTIWAGLGRTDTVGNAAAFKIQA